ncbi:unnamed protein product [Effrenium voratum]|nr:unnamed protein product [Effrenium voratum]
MSLPVPPCDPPIGEATGARFRGVLHGYDSSTTRAPFAYGLIRGEDGEMYFFARAHLERGVIAELLQPGSPLEFSSHEFQSASGAIRWALAVRKAGRQSSRLEARRSRSPKRPARSRRWVSLLDRVSPQVVVQVRGHKRNPKAPAISH